ncbi:Putative ribonuclease H protein At1g65750 [Linum grandiflorum]
MNNSHHRCESLIGWFSPQDAEIIVNTYGSVIQPNGAASDGGILRDPNGITQATFAANMGICTITRVEIRAAIYGLQLAWELGYRKVNLQLDSQVVVSYLNQSDISDPQHRSCILELKQLLNRHWDVLVTHTYIEGNCMADLQAHHGHSLSFGFHKLHTVNFEIINCIQADMFGVSYSRLILMDT